MDTRRQEVIDRLLQQGFDLPRAQGAVDLICRYPENSHMTAAEVFNLAAKRLGVGAFAPLQKTGLPIEDRPYPPPNMPPVSDAPPDKKRKPRPLPEGVSDPAPSVPLPEVRITRDEPSHLARQTKWLYRKGIGFSLWLAGTVIGGGVGVYTFGSVKGAVGFAVLTGIILGFC